MESSGNLLANLPPELLLNILDLLPKISRVSLALTGKALLGMIRPSGIFPVMYGVDRITFRLYVEPKSRHVYSCFTCKRLHDYDPRRESGWRCRGLPGPVITVPGRHHHIRDRVEKLCYPQERRVDASFRPRNRHRREEIRLDWHPARLCGDHRFYRFEEVHLVMNRHFHAFGLSLEVLKEEYQFKRWINILRLQRSKHHFPLAKHRSASQCQKPPVWMPPSRAELDSYLSHDDPEIAPRGTTGVLKERLDRIVEPWEFSHKTRARIIDDELYISSSHTVTGPLLPRSRFDEVIRKLQLPICRHIFSDCPRWEDNMAYPIRSCDFCFTDFQVSIQKSQGEKQWEFALTTYHRLGACRTPADPTWSKLNETERQGHRRGGPYGQRKGKVTFRAGDVRRKWMSNNG
ncbi:hypothetical protein B0I35DRAFT_408514 [Stachybotrys elegans]|uniref:F-box domain-containing protein n=1 Tax=Stachybotrys elegans TaxID=80388 RepID=A0A8K0SSE9_9HYPO|nr:hypothetical protein B0I35DRAFT_408514 [Stachybotrys elegans]